MQNLNIEDLLWAGLLPLTVRARVAQGVDEALLRTFEPWYPSYEAEKFSLYEAWKRGKQALPVQRQDRSELETVEGFSMDGIIQVSWLPLWEGGGERLCVTAEQDLPAGGRLVVARGILVPLEASLMDFQYEHAWGLPDGADFLLSQREMEFANITRYVVRGAKAGMQPNVEMRWEKAFGDTWYSGIGVLTVLGEKIGTGNILAV